MHCEKSLRRCDGGRIGSGLASLRTSAQPSLTQLVLRFGLAVPVWQPGVNKWHGSLQLNDVTILLFRSEFQLHLPGGSLSLPRTGRHGIRRRFSGNDTLLAAVACGSSMSVLNMRPIDICSSDCPSLMRHPLKGKLAPPELVVADIYGANKPQYFHTLIDAARAYFGSIGPSGFAMSIAERHNELLPD